MAVMDEFKNERESMKDKSFKQKISYFWDYYRWHVIIAVAVVVLGGSLIKDITSHKDYGMYGIFLNAFRMVEDTTPFTDDYIEYANINTDEYTVLFDGNVVMNEDMDENSVNASQMLLVHIAAQDLDVMTMDNYNFIKYAYNQTFMDLRDILTPSQMARAQGHLFYVDGAVLAEIDKANEEMQLETEIKFPNPVSPDTMKDPIPVGINVNISDKFQEYYSYGNEDGFFGVVANTHNTENVSALIAYLFGE